MATRYWVGGTGTWDSTSTTNWSTTSGGAGGASAPLATDDVVIDNNSGTGTCTTDATAVARIVTLDSQTCGLTLGANLTLGPELTGASAYNLIVSGGALNLNNYTLTSPRTSFSQTTNTRSVAFGASGKLVSNYGNNTYIGFQFQVGTGFTYTGTSRIEFTYSGANTISAYLPRTSSGGTNATALNYYFTATTGTIKLDAGSAAVVANNIDFTGCTGALTNTSLNVYGNITYVSGMTLTAGTFVTSFVGTSGTQQITTNGVTLDFPLTFNGVGGTFQLQDNCTVGSTRTVTLTNGTIDLNNKTLSCGLFASSNSNTRSIAFGTGNITLTGSGATIWNTSTATGLTYTGTPTVNCTYAGSIGTRQINSSFTDGSLANAFNYNISAGSDIVTFGTSTGRVANNVNFTGFSGSCTDLAKIIYGNLTIPATMTSVASTALVSFVSTSGTKTITTAGLTFNFPLTFNGVGGTWSFADALTQGSTRAFTITNGTVKLKAGATSTVGAFATSGSNQKYLQSTTAGSQATLSQASGTVNVSYLTIKDINATGGATWNAYRNLSNIDAGNNTGWDFLSTPVTTTTLAMRLGFGL